MALVAMREEPHFVAASRGFLDAFDLRRAAVVGRPIANVLASSGSIELAGAIRRCLMTSETLHADVELHGNAGRRVGLAVHDARAQGFTGHVVLEAHVGGPAAVTAQRLASLFDRTRPQGQSLTYLHDLRTHRIRYADAGLAHRLGLSGGALRFSDLRTQVHPDDLVGEAEFEATRRALADEEFLNSTIRVRDRDGEWRLINFRSRVFRRDRDRDGAVRIMLGIATDLTDYTAAALQVAGASLRRAEENERARIGRELHDSTSQYLVAADLGLARVLRSVDLSDEERGRLEGVQASLATAQTEMRAFSYFLHPPELRELGLLRTLEKFCAGFARRSGLHIDFTAHDVLDDLPSDAEHALFRVGQEALMNVYRHAFARRVSVSLGLKDGRLALEVRDDGIGVDGEDRFENGGVGVAGMKARMLSVGGELSLDRRGPGLAVIARVPLPS